MAITVSLVALSLFGLVLYFLLRSKTLGYGSAFIAMMSGIYLASTGASGPMNELTAALVDALPGL